MKERELDIKERLAELQEKQIDSTFLLRRLNELDKSISSGRELVEEGQLGQDLALLESKLANLLREKETTFGKLTAGVIGRSKGEIEKDIDSTKNAIKTAKDTLDIAVTRLTGDFQSEKEQLNKYLKEYGLDYSSGETREDFNLEDQRTVGQ
tara:strand:- start:216 stop:671 length:456 start_codon:yes stop_codon:yes gene_type:complete